MAQSVLASSDKKRFIRKYCPLLFCRLSHNAHRGSLGASGDQTAPPTIYLQTLVAGSNGGKAFWGFFCHSWCSFFRLFSFYLFSMSFFISSRSLLGSILSSQTDPPTLTHVSFMKRILAFLKNQRFRSKDGFESVLGLSRLLLGALGGLLGVSWELLRASGST